MKKLQLTAALTGALLLLLATASLPAQTTPAPSAPPVTATAPVAVYDSITPVSVASAPWWMPRHEEKVSRIKQGNVELLFIGDSITHQWEISDPANPAHNFLPVWQEYYGDRNAVDLGFSGDETQNLLWRFAHGELDGISPKVAVLMVGTNNTGRHLDFPPQRTLIGILAVVEDIHHRLPNTKILLLGIFPTKISPTKTAIDTSINESLKTIYSTSSYVTFMDIGNAFRKDGVIDCSLYGDKSGICLHPTAAGQRNWAEAIEPTLSKMLGDKPKHDITAADVIKKFNIGADTGATNPTTRDASWLKTHQQRLEENSKKRVDLIFLGDSITNNWEKSGPAPDQVFQPIWQEFYGDRNAINLGYSGDRTQHVLWRLQHGEVDGMNPKAVVLMIGTNNTGHDTWQDVLAGDIAIVEELHRRLPNTKVLLLGIFPSDISPEKTVKDENINRVLSLIYAGSSYVTFLDIKNAFYKNGKLDTSIFYDPRLPKPGHALHPDTVGQRKWAEAIEPTLSRMLGDKNKLLK